VTSNHRVFIAIGLILRQRRGIPDDQPYHSTGTEQAKALAGLNRVRRKKLKKIAEGLTSEVISKEQYLAETEMLRTKPTKHWGALVVPHGVTASR
jgi:hypothetical protein